jgi:hypothetical protein
MRTRSDEAPPRLIRASRHGGQRISESRTIRPGKTRPALVGDHLHDGALSLDQVQAIAFQRYAVVRPVPVGAVIDQVLGARGIEPARTQ